MAKWICKSFNCNCGCKVENDDCEMIPCECPYISTYTPFWVKVEETATECSQLPKLTAEVFNRPDCPAWANWAAVDSCGNAYYYMVKPQASSKRWDDSEFCKFSYIGNFDATDWQNSLIERPVKKNQLPDWCKVGEWVAYYGEKGYKYFKIAKIELNRLYSEDGKFSLMCNVAQARLRPYTSEEMKALVGKVIVENKSGDTGLVIGYCNRKESVYAGRNDFAAALLLSDYTIDGKPCGVLEHLNENGEWVE